MLVFVALAGLAAPGLSRAAGEGFVGWASDLAAHWVWLWLPLGAAGLACVTWPWAVRAAAAAAMLLLPWLWLPPAMAAADDGSGQPMRVVVANVHLGNRDPAPLVAWASLQRADVLAIIELHPAYAAALASAAPSWPHRHLMAREDAFGIGLLSRWPLRAVREVEGPGGIAQLHALVDLPAGSVEVVAVHPMPPVSAGWHGVRDRTLAALRPRGDVPALALGDFNATPWSSAAPQLAAGGWRWFGGLQPTWPHAAWGIPIDAVWGHGAWQVSDHAVGPSIGSDHRPVSVGLRVAIASPR